MDSYEEFRKLIWRGLFLGFFRKLGVWEEARKERLLRPVFPPARMPQRPNQTPLQLSALRRSVLVAELKNSVLEARLVLLLLIYGDSWLREPEVGAFATLRLVDRASMPPFFLPVLILLANHTASVTLQGRPTLPLQVSSLPDVLVVFCRSHSKPLRVRLGRVAISGVPRPARLSLIRTYNLLFAGRKRKESS